MRGRAIPYSQDEMAWLEANRLMVISHYARAFAERFERNVSKTALHALRKRKGWKTGRTGCFEKGQTPPNKGKKMPFNANSARTQFKKGDRRGVAIRMYKPIGTERLSKDGYLERKIHDGMPLQSRWRAVHLIEWETKNGPLPKGHCLKCLDGNKLNVDPDNWLAIPRALMPRLAGGNRHRTILPFDEAPVELKPAVLAAAMLEHEAKKARRRIGKLTPQERWQERRKAAAQ